MCAPWLSQHEGADCRRCPCGSKAGILCTYGAIAEMVNNSFTPAVARSIVRNKEILSQEAARVLLWKFFDGKHWAVPMGDSEWTAVAEPDGPNWLSSLSMKA